MMSARVEPERLRAAAEEVGRGGGLRLVVLFGSAARREAGAQDLDIGVLGAGPSDAVAITNRFTRLLGVQGVDVTDLRRADPLLLAQAARDGVPLYEGSEGEFARFASLAIRRFADTRKFRATERDVIRDWVARGSQPR